MRAGEIGKPDCNRSAREESAPILGKRAGKANSRPLHHVSVSARISGVITSNDDPHEGERPYMSRLRNPVRTPYTACGYPNIQCLPVRPSTSITNGMRIPKGALPH